MPRILIAGCGYVGEAAADLFSARGWEVEGWTASARSAERLSGKPYPVRAVDIADYHAVSAASSAFDLIIQCASSGGRGVDEYRKVYLNGAGNLLRVFAKVPLLFTSSTSVYAQEDGSIVDESSLANPPHEKGRILRQTEKVVLEQNGIVARLGGIYGPGRSFLLRKFLSGEAAIDENDDRLINQVHRDDIVAALFLLAERRAEARGQIYNVVDDMPTSRREVYLWLSSRMKQPASALREEAPRRRRGKSNKRVSNRKLRALGWEPRYGDFRVAMEKSVIPSFGLCG